MSFILTVNRVSEAFFLSIGACYLVAYLSWKNNFYAFEAEIFLRLADLPLAFFALLFGFSSLRISLSSDFRGLNGASLPPFKIIDLLMIAFALAIFGLLIYIDIKLPNRFPFPQT